MAKVMITVLSSAIKRLSWDPEYTKVIEIPAIDDGFDTVIEVNLEHEDCVAVVRHNAILDVSVNKEIFRFDLLDPDFEDQIEVLPEELEFSGFSPYLWVESVASEIATKIKYSELMQARSRYRR